MQSAAEKLAGALVQFCSQRHGHRLKRKQVRALFLMGGSLPLKEFSARTGVHARNWKTDLVKLHTNSQRLHLQRGRTGERRSALGSHGKVPLLWSTKGWKAIPALLFLVSFYRMCLQLGLLKNLLPSLSGCWSSGDCSSFPHPGKDRQDVCCGPVGSLFSTS